MTVVHESMFVGVSMQSYWHTIKSLLFQEEEIIGFLNGLATEGNKYNTTC